ncbi:precorrin-4 C(11)-methyltransferase [Saccharicrinis fermentans]|uniref:Cobalt-precorrin-4 C(11)-methyltransferase n=1 Tax=Saccharicrinis fermentans DSM 9555 = JCM 21142 TaxID=869213 RepID=W7Y2C6_9BACT|nr:precorrin-4 C(11)-methyltransferase [Saccharicrinis fermentans]GAF02092.1 cobalt-precorrin-4 C(11)-methyltransferase [Saccharicrinis fermentans DSM 9555 = JCM 21142]
MIIITHSDKGELLAKQLIEKGLGAEVHRSPNDYGVLWNSHKVLVFIGALGICVREIAPYLKDKKTDPAVLNMDVNGQFVQPVVSGHIGGGNQWAKEIGRLCGAQPVITTVSDTAGLWALDLLPQKYSWQLECGNQLTHLMASFVNGEKTALLLEVRDKGTLDLESSAPSHVDVFFNAKEMQVEDYSVVIAVTPFIYDFGDKAIFYRPKVLQLGLGCQRDLPFELFERELLASLQQHKIAFASVAAAGTVDLKADEEAFLAFSKKHHIALKSFDGATLAQYDIPNPSAKVSQVTGSYGVAEAAAMHLSDNGLLVEKTKMKAGEKFFTFSVAIHKENERKGFVEIVGAGPGDPELVSVKGKKLLETADLILYAGSLVPKELTYYAKSGCVVKSSAKMDLLTQIETMRPFYERGLLVVRLHTGDPCIYGAIQEQMAIMDQMGWSYRITPGISSFQAAAAALRSQFTIPEEVQTIILTRGEGRTPVPEREQLRKLAKSQSTMCIYLSASIAEKVEHELIQHYPSETPVAVCYKLTWRDEKIYRCTLGTLAKTVRENKLTMTTLIVVGKAIDNRSGFSKLYDKKFTHAFRQGK